jgi:hypothetical protein
MINMNDTKYFLIEYDSNWADEMDIRGFCVMSEAQKDLYFDYFKKEFKQYNSYCHCVGTNEEIEYLSFKHFSDAFSIQRITLEEKQKIEFLFGIQSFIGDDPDLGPIPDDKLLENHNYYGHFPWEEFNYEETDEDA